MRKLLFLLLSLVVPALSAQVRPSTLPRITSTSGLADSSLFICNDSTNTRTRSCTLFSIRKRLQFKSWDSLIVSRLVLSGGTVVGVPTWASLQTFAAGQRVDSATGAARATTSGSASTAVQLTNTRTIWGQSFNGTANVSGALTGVTTLAASGQISTSAGPFLNTTSGTAAYNFYSSLYNVSTTFSGIMSLVTNGTTGLTIGNGPASIATAPVALVAGTDVPSATAKLRIGDGTAVSSNDAVSTTSLGSMSTAASSTVGTQFGSEFVLKGTASGANAYYALRGYGWAGHSSGTFNLLRGVQGIVETGASGGTVTQADATSGFGFVPSGATVTNLALLRALAPAGSGTITNLWGVKVEDMGTGAAKWALQTGTGLVQFGDMLVTAASTTSRTGLRLVSGAAPSSPVAGDVYYDGINTTINSSGLAVTGVVGTATNDDAVAGRYGEYMSHTTVSGSAISLTSTVVSTIDSLSLTAGDWDVTGVVDFTFGAATSYTNLQGALSTTRSAYGLTDAGFSLSMAATVPGSTSAAMPVAVVRLSVASTTKVYLVASSVFGVSTLTTYGTIRARRVR